MKERQGYNPEEHVARLTSEGENSTLKQNSFSEKIQKGGFNMGDTGDNTEQPLHNIDMDDLNRQIYEEVKRRLDEDLTQADIEAMNAMNNIDSWQYIPKDEEQSQAPETVVKPETISEKAANIRERLNGAARDIVLRRKTDPNEGIRALQIVDRLLEIEDDQQLIDAYPEFSSEVYSIPESREEKVENDSPQASEELIIKFDNFKDHDEFIQKLLDSVVSSEEEPVREAFKQLGEFFVRLSATGTGREDEYAEQLKTILSEEGNIKGHLVNLLAEIRADVATIDYGADQTYEEAISMPSGLTQDAKDLLEKVDSGSVPGFVSNNLIRIANENGVEVTDGMTPNEIIEALRAKSSISGTQDDEQGTEEMPENSELDKTAEPLLDGAGGDDGGGNPPTETPASPEEPENNNNDEVHDAKAHDVIKKLEEGVGGENRDWLDALSDTIMSYGNNPDKPGDINVLREMLRSQLGSVLESVKGEIYDSREKNTWEQKLNEIIGRSSIRDIKSAMPDFLKKLKTVFTEREGGPERERLPDSFEDLLELIMSKEGDDYKTGGRRELLTKDGVPRAENFYAWVRDKAVYWSNFNSDSTADLFNLIAVPMTYRNLNLNEMTTNTQFFRRKTKSVLVDKKGRPSDRNGKQLSEDADPFTTETYHEDDYYVKIKETIQQEIFIYNMFRNFNILYNEVKEQDSELPKRVAEILSKNHLTQKGKDGLKIVLSIGSTAFADVIGDKKGKEENHLVGEGVALAFSIYDNISDYKELVRLLGADAAFFAKNLIDVKSPGKLDSIKDLTIEEVRRYGFEGARDARAGKRREDVVANVSGIKIKFDEDWFDENGLLINEDWAKYRFMDYLNIFNEAKKDTRIIEEVRERIRQTLLLKMLPDLEESSLHERLRIDTRSQILGREGINGEEFDQMEDSDRKNVLREEIEVEAKKLLMQFAYEDAVYAEEVGRSMVYWTGTGAKLDTTATGFDAGTKYFETAAYRVRQGDENRGGGGVGNIKDIAINKRLLVPLMRGVVTSTRFEEDGNEQLTPSEIVLKVARNIGKRQEKRDTDREGNKTTGEIATGEILDRIVFADNATKDYGGNHYMRGGKTFESLAGAEELDLSKIVTYDPYKGYVVNKAELIEQFNENYLKPERYRTATYDGVVYTKKFKFIDIIKVNKAGRQLPEWVKAQISAENDLEKKEELRKELEDKYAYRNLVFEEQNLAEAMYGAQVFDRDFRNPDGTVNAQKVQDRRSAFWKEPIMVRLGALLSAHTDNNDPSESWNVSRIQAFIGALKMVPADIDIDEKDFWNNKANKRFFNEGLEKHMRKLSKTEQWRIYGKAYAGNLSSGIVAGMLEVVKEFAEETIAS